MALQTKTIQATGSTGHHYFTLYLTEESVDTVNNTSKISWRFTLTPKQNNWDWYGWGSNVKYTVNINGSTYSGTIPSYDGVSEYLLASSDEEGGNITIAHNADGSKRISASISVNSNGYTQNYLPGTASASDTMDLTNIPRKAVLEYAPIEFTDEDEEITIEYSNPAGNTVTSLQACIALGWEVIVPYRDISKTGTEYTFKLTDDERSKLRKAATKNYLEVNFFVTTVLNGETLYSYQASEMEIVNPMPTLAPTVTDVGAVSKVLTGKPTSALIKGFNSIEYVFNAVPQKEATITNYSVTCGSMKGDAASGKLYNVESGTFVFTVTDSRGNTVSKTVTLSVVNYIEPTCNQKVEIALDGETSAKVSLTISGNYFNGSFGAVNNSLRLYVKHTQNDSTAGDWVELTDGLIPTLSGNTYELNTTISGFNYDGSYTFQSKAVDRLGEEVFSAEYVAKLEPVFDWSETDFNFNVPVSFQGETMADFIVETSTAAMGTNGTWYIEKWKSGKAVCYGTRNYGNMGVEDGISNTFTQAYPTGLFIQRPDVVHIQVAYHEEEFWAYIGKAYGGYGSKTQTEEFCVLVNGEWTGTLPQTYISFNIIGRWK